MRSREERDLVATLVADGLNDCLDEFVGPKR
jgi:hypothetical protein